MKFDFSNIGDTLDTILVKYRKEQEREKIEYIYSILKDTEENLYQSDLILLKECFRHEARRENEEINIFKEVYKFIYNTINNFLLRR